MQFFHSSLKEMEKEYKAVVIKGRIVDSAGSAAILAWELVYKGISYLGNIIYKQALEFFHWLCRILYFNSALHFCSHTSLDFWPVASGRPQGLSGKESTCNVGNAGDWGSIPGSGRSPGGGHGNPLQYSCLENPMDRGDWWATVCRS